jgi:hypothetical protein
MAVQTTKTQSAMILKYKEGVDTSGKDIIKTQKLSKVKVGATDDNIHAVAEAFEPLLKYPVVEIVREDENLLTNI